jgi:16S rRNA (uracil1498-N3)-methyltransferase
MRLFYEPNILDSKCLDAQESQHAIKVLRLKQGDDIEVIDGKLNSYLCKISEANASKCLVDIISKTSHSKKPYTLELVIAPTKNIDRVEWLLEKAIEIGVDAFTLITTQRTERTKVRFDRLEKIAISAMKQSKNFLMPKMADLQSFDAFIDTPFHGQKFIAHCIDDNKQHLKNALKANESYRILIGPEGDFTKEEIELALKNGYVPVSLGDTRLRTETAALYACATASIING